MRITPLDVRKQEFKRGMRGYDCDEVRAFLSNLADEYEAVLVDNKQLRERVVEQDEKLGEYRNLERTLRDTLMTAERVTQEARDTARKQGELMVQEARQRVDRVLAEGLTRLNDLRREALAVHREKETYLGRFRSLAEAQIQFVESHRSDFRDLDGRMLESGDVAADQPADPPWAGPVVTPGEPTPAARIDRGQDEWRDYAIAAREAEKAAESARIAAALQQAGQVAALPFDAAGDRPEDLPHL
ncbi:MAG TPA: DivIVA domain-containing protein [Candidatus Krumholzibacteria bacterium]|nr:DivIVA domain-containing protein [Candidatus Krumholzibacteria bacterium]HPD71054.1 DivIVA domain-containing protein [Candidatus Krumholzibacteria bacterium]HRY39246.1 DivIVA domain-containing protein [Candidatus Krumholzibacteria bacterium]